MDIFATSVFETNVIGNICISSSCRNSSIFTACKLGRRYKKISLPTPRRL